MVAPIDPLSKAASARDNGRPKGKGRGRGGRVVQQSRDVANESLVPPVTKGHESRDLRDGEDERGEEEETSEPGEDPVLREPRDVEEERLEEDPNSREPGYEDDEGREMYHGARG